MWLAQSHTGRKRQGRSVLPRGRDRARPSEPGLPTAGKLGRATHRFFFPQKALLSPPHPRPHPPSLHTLWASTSEVLCTIEMSEA